MNYLYLGDCLTVLQDEVKEESVDLIYIDPPFNSKRNYNVLFEDKEIQVQRLAFEDTWSVQNVNDSMQRLRTFSTEKLYNLLRVYQDVAPQVFPYLVMMTLRILELHRVLKSTGSFYLHCDSTASHYLKTVCDVVFGAGNFRNEIIWKRQSAHSDAKYKFSSVADIILFYAKSKSAYFKLQYGKYQPEYVAKFYRHDDQDGRGLYQLDNMASPNPRPNMMYEWRGFACPQKGWRYRKETMQKLHDEGRIWYPRNTDGTLDTSKRLCLKRYLQEQEGLLIPCVWTDIQSLHAVSAEYLDYPTQKPKALLERIIHASSNEGDLILDAFCGCGTTVDVAEGLRRRWVGIDISPFAISLVKHRLQDTYQGDLAKFEIRGIPTDEPSAIKLWEQNAFAFQDWWITEFEAFSTTFGKKGADTEVDAIALYAIPKAKSIKVAFQVNGGDCVQSKDLDALLSAMVKQNCALGVLLTRVEPTCPMLETMTQLGYYEVGSYRYPKLQVLTLQEFFAGKRLKLPTENITFKSAATIGKGGEQGELRI